MSGLSGALGPRDLEADLAGLGLRLVVESPNGSLAYRAQAVEARWRAVLVVEIVYGAEAPEDAVVVIPVVGGRALGHRAPSIAVRKVAIDARTMQAAMSAR